MISVVFCINLITTHQQYIPTLDYECKDELPSHLLIDIVRASLHTTHCTYLLFVSIDDPQVRVERSHPNIPQFFSLHINRCLFFFILLIYSFLSCFHRILSLAIFLSKAKYSTFNALKSIYRFLEASLIILISYQVLRFVHEQQLCYINSLVWSHPLRYVTLCYVTLYSNMVVQWFSALSSYEIGNSGVRLMVHCYSNLIEIL